MSPWLKKSLTFWFAGSLTAVGLAGICISHAQDIEYGTTATYSTPLAAALAFRGWIKQAELRRQEDIDFRTMNEGQTILWWQDWRAVEDEGLVNIARDLARLDPLKGCALHSVQRTGDVAKVNFFDPRGRRMKTIFVHRKWDAFWEVRLLPTYSSLKGLSEAEGAREIDRVSRVILPDYPVSKPYYSSICQSRLKQIGLALSNYVQDWDDRYPPAPQWHSGLESYLKQGYVPAKYFQCPADKSKTANSYAYNAHLSCVPQTVANINDSAEFANTPMLYDSRSRLRNGYSFGQDVENRHTVNGIPGANYLYADWHMAWRSAKQSPAFTFVRKSRESGNGG